MDIKIFIPVAVASWAISIWIASLVLVFFSPFKEGGFTFS